MLTIEEHPLLDAQVFRVYFGGRMEDCQTDARLQAAMRLDHASPFAANDDALRKQVRGLLRHAGFRPSGRSKPASEYLLRVAGQPEGLASINLAVDICNAVSLHSGLPISVVDAQLAHGPYRIAVAEPGSSYVFNPSGQVLDLGNLLCLFDDTGPCANAVKDSQRTKTHAETEEVLVVIWGTNQAPGRAEQAAAWYRELAECHGGRCEALVPTEQD